MSTPSLQQTLAACRARGEAALVAYVVAGDPSLAATEKYVAALAQAGADVIELGVPFSDPLADGPVNQRASERALRAGTTLRGVLECVRRLRDSGLTTPLVLFTYLNPVLQMGLERFTNQAQQVGVTGVLVVDLPPEEAEDYQRRMAARNLETVFLAAPTTPPNRLALISAATTGFVYYVSRTGVTGVQAALSETVLAELQALRQQVRQPVVVGFGIASPEHARELAAHADGVVIGSALVQCIASSTTVEESAARLTALTSQIKAALRPPERAS